MTMTRAQHGGALATMAFATGALTVMGRWSQGKKVEPRVVIGLIGLLIFLSLLGEADQRLSMAFAAMVLVSALFMYGPDIFRKFGLIQ